MCIYNLCICTTTAATTDATITDGRPRIGWLTLNSRSIATLLKLIKLITIREKVLYWLVVVIISDSKKIIAVNYSDSDAAAAAAIA